MGNLTSLNFFFFFFKYKAAFLFGLFVEPLSFYQILCKHASSRGVAWLRRTRFSWDHHPPVRLEVRVPLFWNWVLLFEHEAHDRSWRCSWDLGVCIQFSIHEMNRWRGSSESHTIRVTLSFGKASVRILRPFTPCLSKF